MCPDVATSRGQDNLAVLATWYRWAIGALTVVLAAGVDTNTPAAIGTTVAVFVLGILAATGWAPAVTLRASVERRT